MLERIDSPADLRTLTYPELAELADDIRRVIIDTVGKNGGHLASNLGMVETTIALHRVYDSPRDKLLFDVGHQCYAHKLITGRRKQFATIRTEGGLCGFPLRTESEHDAFGVGHASTALSAALGMARARDLLGERFDIAAVIGDGALTGGEAYEALNDAGSSQRPMVVILNDNGMSIESNVGALSRTLTHARVSGGYWRLKNSMTRLFGRMAGVGDWLYGFLQGVKNSFKYLFVRGGRFFDSLGFVYIGPVDGHDIRELEHTLRRARSIGKPVVVHVITRKGKGSADAEEHPALFHGVSPNGSGNGEVSCAQVVAESLCELARSDRRIAAVTAAMPQSTGLSRFAKEHPERMFDVGIAEEHAATLCAGMAAAGLKPYFAVYSTFLQRAFDQVVHDIALQGLPVTILADRAGLCGEDGVTHQGIYDLVMTLPLAGMTVLAPRTARELRAMLAWSAGHDGPVLIRYPRSLPAGGEDESAFAAPGHWQCLQDASAPLALLGVGPMADVALMAAQQSGVEVRVYAVGSVSPVDEACLQSLAGCRIITVEEGSAVGGFGALIAKRLGVRESVRVLGVSGEPVPHGHVAGQRARCGLTAQAVCAVIREEAQHAAG